MTADAIRFLSTHLDQLAHMPHAEEAWDEIGHAAASLERMLDRRTAATFRGTCDVCGRDLYATPEATEVQCRPCGVNYDTATLRQNMLDALDDRLVRASEAAVILPTLGTTVSRKDVDRWAQSNRIVPHGRDERGRPLYLVREVREIAAVTTRRGPYAKTQRRA